MIDNDVIHKLFAEIIAHWLSVLSFSFDLLISHEAIVTGVRYSCYTHTGFLGRMVGAFHT